MVRIFSGEVFCTMNGKPGNNRRITPEGEPLEDTGGGGRFLGGGRGGGLFGRGPNSLIKILIPSVIGLIIVAFLIMNSVKIVGELLVLISTRQ